MLGSLDEAKTAVSFKRCPGAGWARVGDGSTRIVWRAPSGVCYKVNNVGYGARYIGSMSANEVESRNFAQILKNGTLPPGWHIPEHYLWTFKHKGCQHAVLAVEYLAGESPEYDSKEYREFVEALDATGMSDGASVNCMIMPDGRKYLIDGAEGYLIGDLVPA